jgi:hypothetical protein
MSLKAWFEDDRFVPLEDVEGVEEGEVVEIETSTDFSWRGGLKHRDVDSVELQHEIKEMW